MAGRASTPSLSRRVFTCSVLHERNGLLAEVVAFDLYAALLKLGEQGGKICKFGIDIRPADSCRATHGWIVDLECIHILTFLFLKLLIC